MSEYEEAKAKLMGLVRIDEQKARLVADLMLECRRALTDAEQQEHPLAQMTREAGSNLSVVDWPEILPTVRSYGIY